MLGEHDVAHQEHQFGPEGVWVSGWGNFIGAEDFGCVEWTDYGVGVRNERGWGDVL